MASSFRSASSNSIPSSSSLSSLITVGGSSIIWPSRTALLTILSCLSLTIINASCFSSLNYWGGLQKGTLCLMDSFLSWRSSKYSIARDFMTFSKPLKSRRRWFCAYFLKILDRKSCLSPFRFSLGCHIILYFRQNIIKLATVNILNCSLFSFKVLWPPSCCYCLHRYVNNFFKESYFSFSGVMLSFICYLWNFYFSALTMALSW